MFHTNYYDFFMLTTKLFSSESCLTNVQPFHSWQKVFPFFLFIQPFIFNNPYQFQANPNRMGEKNEVRNSLISKVKKYQRITVSELCMSCMICKENVFQLVFKTPSFPKHYFINTKIIRREKRSATKPS